MKIIDDIVTVRHCDFGQVQYFSVRKGYVYKFFAVRLTTDTN